MKGNLSLLSENQDFKQKMKIPCRPLEMVIWMGISQRTGGWLARAR
jgi:hypothetical protein